MILTNKNAPLSIGADAGAIKISQDDSITISTEEYSIYIADMVKIDMIAAVLASDNLPDDSEKIVLIRMLLDIAYGENT